MLLLLLRRLLGGRGGIPLAGLVPTDAGTTALVLIPDFCGGMFCAIGQGNASLERIHRKNQSPLQMPINRHLFHLSSVFQMASIIYRT